MPAQTDIVPSALRHWAAAGLLELRLRSGGTLLSVSSPCRPGVRGDCVHGRGWPPWRGVLDTAQQADQFLCCAGGDQISSCQRPPLHGGTAEPGRDAGETAGQGGLAVADRRFIWFLG
jgi:hypothetical protein